VRVEAILGGKPPPQRRRHHEAAKPDRCEIVWRTTVARRSRLAVAPPLLVHRDLAQRAAHQRPEHPHESAVAHPLGTGALTTEHPSTIWLFRIEVRDRREPLSRHQLPRRSVGLPRQRSRYRCAGSGGPTWDQWLLTRHGYAGPDT